MNLDTNKESSLKKFRRGLLKKINLEYLLFTDVIKRKILSKTDLDKYIKSGNLTEVKFKNKRYIEKTRLFKLLKGKN